MSLFILSCLTFKKNWGTPAVRLVMAQRRCEERGEGGRGRGRGYGWRGREKRTKGITKHRSKEIQGHIVVVIDLKGIVDSEKIKNQGGRKKKQ